MTRQNHPLIPLIRHNVSFVVIGGLAVNAHGYIRNTEDADLVFLRTPEGELALLAALTEMNACHVSAETDPKTGAGKLIPVTTAFIRVNHVLMLVTDAGFLDLFDYIPGFPDEPVDSLFTDSELRDGMRFVSLPWLLKMKRAANRPKDLDDIANLTA